MAGSRSTTSFGHKGEQLAANYLLQKGYAVVAKNWHCKYGEIDIIARKEEFVIFVEVRTRHADSSEPAFESITPRKRERLIQSAHTYLVTQNLGDCIWRIDVIAIGVPRSGIPIIEHTEDALDW